MIKHTIKNLLIYVFTFCCLIMISGCVEIFSLIGIAGEAVFTLAPDKTSNVNRKQNFIPVTNVDTEETIIKNMGNPNEIIVIDNQKKVLFYEGYATTNLYAIKNGVYQTSLEATTDSLKESKANGVLKSGMIRIFPCFHDTAPQPTPPQLASYTPTVGDTFAKVTENLGEPNDSFLLKDEKGEPVAGTTLVWYFEVKNDQLTRVLSMYIRDGVVSKVEERTSDKPPYTIGFYKSYLYLCATMAYRAPRFAFALNESSPVN